MKKIEYEDKTLLEFCPSCEDVKDAIIEAMFKGLDGLRKCVCDKCMGIFDKESA